MNFLPDVGPVLFSTNQFFQSFEPHISEGRKFPASGFPIEIDRKSISPVDLFADSLRNPDHFPHIYVLQRNQGNHIRGTDSGVNTLVFTDIYQFHRHPYRIHEGLLHLPGSADDCKNAPVVVGIHMYIENLHSGQFESPLNPGDNLLVPSLRKVGNCFY